MIAEGELLRHMDCLLNDVSNALSLDGSEESYQRSNAIFANLKEKGFDFNCLFLDFAIKERANPYIICFCLKSLKSFEIDIEKSTEIINLLLNNIINVTDDLRRIFINVVAEISLRSLNIEQSFSKIFNFIKQSNLDFLLYFLDFCNTLLSVSEYPYYKNICCIVFKDLVHILPDLFQAYVNNPSKMKLKLFTGFIRNIKQIECANISLDVLFQRSFTNICGYVLSSEDFIQKDCLYKELIFKLLYKMNRYYICFKKNINLIMDIVMKHLEPSLKEDDLQTFVIIVSYLKYFKNEMDEFDINLDFKTVLLSLIMNFMEKAVNQNEIHYIEQVMTVLLYYKDNSEYGKICLTVLEYQMMLDINYMVVPKEIADVQYILTSSCGDVLLIFHSLNLILEKLNLDNITNLSYKLKYVYYYTRNFTESSELFTSDEELIESLTSNIMELMNVLIELNNDDYIEALMLTSKILNILLCLILFEHHINHFNVLITNLIRRYGHAQDSDTDDLSNYRIKIVKYALKIANKCRYTNFSDLNLFLIHPYCIQNIQTYIDCSYIKEFGFSIFENVVAGKVDSSIIGQYCYLGAYIVKGSEIDSIDQILNILLHIGLIKEAIMLCVNNPSMAVHIIHNVSRNKPDEDVLLSCKELILDLCLEDKSEEIVSSVASLLSFIINNMDIQENGLQFKLKISELFSQLNIDKISDYMSLDFYEFFANWYSNIENEIFETQINIASAMINMVTKMLNNINKDTISSNIIQIITHLLNSKNSNMDNFDINEQISILIVDICQKHDIGSDFMQNILCSIFQNIPESDTYIRSMFSIAENEASYYGKIDTVKAMVKAIGSVRRLYHR